MHERKRILIIEDDEILSRVMYDRLNSYNEFEVMAALTGEEGIKVFSEFEPEILILDIELPDISGFELLKKFKKSKPEIRVIIISVYGTEENKKRAEELRSEKFFEKPFELENIITFIKDDI